ncbi:MAG: spore coat protein CotJB [Lachnospiraceae bacterium]|nr:spore coat protein CotJB [Lachnospiraceae bacterium]
MSDRQQLMKQITEISFVIDDLVLYLDTHPLDTDALDQVTQAMAQRKELLGAYAKDFEPLTRCCIRPDTNNASGQHTKYAGQKHWTWTDGPLPWEGGM